MYEKLKHVYCMSVYTSKIHNTARNMTINSEVRKENVKTKLH